MNQRESSGLPLRAMVMVLLFLGVVFLLVGLQAMGSDGADNSSSATSVATVTTTATSTSQSPAPAARVDVWVFNTSGVSNAGADVVARLVRPNWVVPEAGNRDPVEGLAVTTVYFSPGSASDAAAARQIGELLGNAPVVERIPALDDVKPGVVVLVAAPPS